MRYISAYTVSRELLSRGEAQFMFGTFAGILAFLVFLSKESLLTSKIPFIYKKCIFSILGEARHHSQIRYSSSIDYTPLGM
jgi:hypothetical protein